MDSTKQERRLLPLLFWWLALPLWVGFVNAQGYTLIMLLLAALFALIGLAVSVLLARWPISIGLMLAVFCAIWPLAGWLLYLDSTPTPVLAMSAEEGVREMLQARLRQEMVVRNIGSQLYLPRDLDLASVIMHPVVALYGALWVVATIAHEDASKRKLAKSLLLLAGLSILIAGLLRACHPPSLFIPEWEEGVPELYLLHHASFAISAVVIGIGTAQSMVKWPVWMPRIAYLAAMVLVVVTVEYPTNYAVFAPSITQMMPGAGQTIVMLTGPNNLDDVKEPIISMLYLAIVTFKTWPYLRRKLQAA